MPLHEAADQIGQAGDHGDQTGEEAGGEAAGQGGEEISDLVDG